MSDPFLSFADMGGQRDRSAAAFLQETLKPLSYLPSELPVLPLRNVVIYPLTLAPIRVNRPRSLELVDDVIAADRLMVVVASKDIDLEEPGPDDLYRTGVIVMVHRVFKAPEGNTLVLQGMTRVRLDSFTQTEPYLRANLSAHPEAEPDGVEVEALQRGILDVFGRLADLLPALPNELTAMIRGAESPLQLAYILATHLRMPLETAQQILEYNDAEAKLRELLTLLSHEVEVAEVGQKIQNEAQSEIEKNQREYILRHQLEAIRKELGEGDEHKADVEEFERKIAESAMPEEAQQEARRELERLQRVPMASPEYGVIRTYLDWLVNLPWQTTTNDNLNLAHAREVLNEDHYDLEKIKERILEYLAVRRLRLERTDDEANAPPDYLRREREGALLCFVGPPGTGKTSLGRSIARALGREFVRQSLGGVRDEAEIRGHRRTYIGALPGRIMQAIRRVGSKNPVFMLDEIDKLGADFRGDPASALLEVLDPEQNREFRDHYLDVPFDLSEVLFITTANWLDPIPAPLRDRMEIITLAGYTDFEKRHIARGYLIPRQIRENGLRAEEITFSDNALHAIISDYTREAGVRNLEREIGRVCRKIATGIAEDAKNIASQNAPLTRITQQNLHKYLGPQRFLAEVAQRTAIPGVATGLAWTPTGGELIFIEATHMPGNQQFTVTGKLGEVMKESAQAALSYVRAHTEELHIAPEFFKNTDIHVHVPAGAVPKDGPSAGVTIAVALVSLLTGQCVHADVGMTGELTLRGQILPIGGVKEKILAAHRAGLARIILPRENKKDLVDLPAEVRRDIETIFVERVEEALSAALQLPAAPTPAKTPSEEL